jgi:Adenylate and Guanylate cyclase catalytic domain
VSWPSGSFRSRLRRWVCALRAARRIPTGNGSAASAGTSWPSSAARAEACGGRVSDSETAAVQAPVAERRLVTVLFADLVGFTAASEGRDAEDTRELLSRYFDTCRRFVSLYGGTVEKFIGDAVMAVWGAAVANEDAERAVQAALDLLDAIPELDRSLTARAGAHRRGGGNCRRLRRRHRRRRPRQTPPPAGGLPPNPARCWAAHPRSAPPRPRSPIRTPEPAN